MVQPPDTIRTTRLVLRRPKADDAAAVFQEYAADPEVTRHLAWTPHSSLQTVTRFLADVIERWEAGLDLA